MFCVCVCVAFDFYEARDNRILGISISYIFILCHYNLLEMDGCYFSCHDDVSVLHSSTVIVGGAGTDNLS